MNTELKFNIVDGDGAGGGSYLKASLDDSSGYLIDQEGDKFNVGFYEPSGFNYIFKDLLTIYTALDYANSHYHYNLLSPEDQYVMPIRGELEIYEDNQPDKTKENNLTIGTIFGDSTISYRIAEI